MWYGSDHHTHISIDAKILQMLDTRLPTSIISPKKALSLDFDTYLI
jgi:hypothetical protein